MIYKLLNIYKIAVRLDNFKTLDSVEDIVKYLDSEFEKLDSGSSRNVYFLNNRKVIKVIKPNNTEPGIEQNKAEFDMNEHFKTLGIDCFAKVYEHHPKFYWIISELVRPVKDNKELASLLNIST